MKKLLFFIIFFNTIVYAQTGAPTVRADTLKAFTSGNRQVFKDSATYAKAGAGKILGTNGNATIIPVTVNSPLRFQNTILDVDTSTDYSGLATRAYVQNNLVHPAGSNTQIQYNDNGVFGANAGLTWDKMHILRIADVGIGGSVFVNIFNSNGHDWYLGSMGNFSTIAPATTFAIYDGTTDTTAVYFKRDGQSVFGGKITTPTINPQNLSTAKFVTYDGSKLISTAFDTTNSGDITAVTAGNGTQGGGTSGAVTIDASPKALGGLVVTTDSLEIDTTRFPATDYDVSLKVTANGAITGATKTKITYDTKGLVTAGADATTADIAASTDKNYVTDTQLTVIQNTSGTNTGDQTDITGNAATATKLQTARTINGVSFDGSANITVTAAGSTLSDDVTNSTFRQSAGLSVVGRSASTVGDVADITGTADQVLRVNTAGTALGFGTIANAGLAYSSTTLNSGTNFGITAPGAMSLGSTYTIGATTDNLFVAGLGLGVSNSGLQSLTLANGKDFAIHNITPDATNYERLRLHWLSNVATISAERGGTGSQRSLQLRAEGSSGNFTTLTLKLASAPFFAVTHPGWGAGGNWYTWSGTSITTGGTVNVFSITPTYNQTSGTAANTDLLINRTETALGSGTQLLADFQTGGASKFSFSNVGTFTETYLALGTTSTDGVVLQNTTAATAGVTQQYSPRLRLTGTAWKSNATAASQTDDWMIENRPQSGAGITTSQLVFAEQINGGGYVDKFTFFSSGGVGIGTSTDPGGGVLDVGTGFRINGAAGSGNIPIGNGTNFVQSAVTYPNSATSGGVMYASADDALTVNSNFRLAAGGTVSKANNVNTAGLGAAWIYQQPAVSATKTGNFTVFSYTPPASAGVYRVSCVITTTSSTNTGTLQVTLDYKDSQGATHTGDIIPLFGSAGTLAASQTSAASKEFHTTDYIFTINNAQTAIALKVVITGTVSYTVTGTLEQTN